ncbi:PIN-like domain-containing protein [Lactococcus petauri]|uniref:PIN-like domain-containing protein n=1 Tax=Lactococcus petauri TaxID=1940789 RepID=UPI003854178E
MNNQEYNDLRNIDKKFFLENAILIFDSSSLLGFYSYKLEIAITMLEQIADKFHGRMYLPNHVIYEYEKNRDFVRKSPIKLYKDIIEEKKEQQKGESDQIYLNIRRDINNFNTQIDKTANSLRGKLKSVKERYTNDREHPFIPENFLKDFSIQMENYIEMLDNIKKYQLLYETDNILNDAVNLQIEKIEKQLETDDLKERIYQYFLLGREYSFSEKLSIAQEGEFRYHSEIPPGYKDYAKRKQGQGIQIYGDLFIWKQIMEICKNNHYPCIFVSNDVKNDWNEPHDKKLIKRDLLEEFFDETGQNIWKCTLEEFMYSVSRDLEIQKEIVFKEIKEYLFDYEITLLNEIYPELYDDIKNNLSEEVEGAIETEITDEEFEILSISLKEIKEIEDSSIDSLFNATYDIKAKYTRELSYYEYLAKDPDTKEIILSPESTFESEGIYVYSASIFFTFLNKEIKQESIDFSLQYENTKERNNHWAEKNID